MHALRNDLYLQRYPEKRLVEAPKRAGQKGSYFMPQLHGQGPERKLLSGPQEAVQVPLKLR